MGFTVAAVPLCVAVIGWYVGVCDGGVGGIESGGGWEEGIVLPPFHPCPHLIYPHHLCWLMLLGGGGLLQRHHCSHPCCCCPKRGGGGGGGGRMVGSGHR